MAAFTSVKTGDWNDPTVWGNLAGGAYPFKAAAADTATVATTHVVTITANKLFTEEKVKFTALKSENGIVKVVTCSDIAFEVMRG